MFSSLETLKQAVRSLPFGMVFMASLLSVLFSIFPGSWWYTVGGGMRWDWGYPIPYVEVHGKSPVRGEWGFCDFYYGPGYLGFLADLLFWTVLLLFASLLARKVSNMTRGHVRSGFMFAAITSVLVFAYITFYDRVWTTFILRVFADAT
jgi:hypothetical protein